ncbi:transcription initiation factor IIF subunit alpha-like [Selaginella moellendorffii]|uniref:transcription initiation factor IIF subunit alpha-like n=1 Tax=Selaginella moellendorffii TaxID=88036 RepID=UPI000D1C3A97|nr:transcription initiation factor IIF subunit alpha-like [Selaginella moellendorffii]|eukprot:XP_024525276.1 transcription initiation factor IIF subunit alpha-like [Selaginella moellendorffii]
MMHAVPGAAASGDLVLRSNCERCGAPGASNELFAASCRHMTLCMACGKSMAEAKASCGLCGATVTTLIKEYKVKRAPNPKQCFLGRFSQGLPLFSTKNNLHWTMRKDIPRPTDPAREKFKITAEKLKSKPWILEDDTGAYQFQGQLEGGQQATYYILMKSGRDFHAFPAGSWFNFHKLVQYKQLTLEEAEEQMKNRRKTADGYQRWIMKAANGAAAFGEVEKTGRQRKEDDDDKKKGTKVAEDDDLAKPEDFDPEDEVDRGDDWEHEETFTDDDEAVGNDPEERDEQPDVPAPPEIKQEEDEIEAEEGGQPQQGENALSQSGRDMKKLLGKSGGLEESEDDDDEEDEDMDLDNENISSPVLAPKHKDEAGDATPTKSANARPPGGPSAASKNKRKVDDGKTAAASKKSKTETKKEVPAVKKESPSTVKKDAPKKEAAKPAAGASTSSASSALEEEVKAVLKDSGPMKSQDLVARFRSRLKNKEEKNAFAMVLKKISRIQKRDGASYIVLNKEER